VYSVQILAVVVYRTVPLLLLVLVLELGTVLYDSIPVLRYCTTYRTGTGTGFTVYEYIYSRL
jgi:hypothetical protein